MFKDNTKKKTILKKKEKKLGKTFCRCLELFYASHCRDKKLSQETEGKYKEKISRIDNLKIIMFWLLKSKNKY